jgi:arylsulfatase A
MAGQPGGRDGIPTNYTQAKIGLSLFNLGKDIGETTDVKEKHPKVLARLQALGQVMRSELGDLGQKGSGQREPGRLAKR